jgi:hypothetical protein
MVYFEQHVILPAETKFYVGTLNLVLLLLILVIGYAGVMTHRLSVAVTTLNEFMHLPQAERRDEKRE